MVYAGDGIWFHLFHWFHFDMLTTYQKPSGILLWFWNMLYRYNCLIHVVKIASCINLIYQKLPVMLKTIKTPMEYSTRLLESNNCPLIYNCLIHYDFILVMLSKSFLSLIYSIELCLPCWKLFKKTNGILFTLLRTQRFSIDIQLFHYDSILCMLAKSFLLHYDLISFMLSKSFLFHWFILSKFTCHVENYKNRTEYFSRSLELHDFSMIYNCLIHYNFIFLCCQFHFFHWFYLPATLKSTRCLIGLAGLANSWWK